MKNKNDLFKESLSDNFYQSVPSIDFTDEVMRKVELSSNTSAVYKPLISKKWWKIIGSISILLILISFTFESNYTLPSLYTTINLPNLEDFKTSIQLSGLIILLLTILTLMDLIYRKYKHMT